MYLKSTHSRLLDGGHQWEVTLFCNAEANTIGSVDILPKTRGSKVVPNDAKPAPTAYTMVYTSSKNDQPPPQFTAIITLLKTNEKKTVTVPANMETDRKRRRADGSVDDGDGADPNAYLPSPPPPPPPPPPAKDERKRKGLCRMFVCGSNSSDPEKGEASKGCCCIIM